MKTARLALLLAAALLFHDAHAQQQPLTLEAIHASRLFSGTSFEGGRWAQDGPVVVYVAREDGGATGLMSYNLETDARTRLLDGSRLDAADVGRRIAIEDYAYSADGGTVLLYTDSAPVWRLNTQGYYYLYDTASGRLTPLAPRDRGYQMFAKLSPDGKRAAFVRNRNLFVVDLATMQETALTTDGAPGTIINGTTDWVYEEEFGLRDGWSWSPDGRFIAFVQLDESNTREYPLADLRGQYPEFTRFRYPKAGEANSEIRVGVADVAAGTLRFFETDTWQAGGDAHEYIPLLGWTPGDAGAQVWMFRLNRDQNALDVLYGDPQTMAVKTVLTERSDTWIDVETGFSDLDVGALTYLRDGKHFIWVSERTGYRHLYLYQNDGTLVRQLTDGDWDVTNFLGADEEKGLIYFVSTAASPVERHLYKQQVSLGAREASKQPPVQITREKGWHDVSLSRDRRYYIDTYSTARQPPVVSLHRVDGTPLKTLESNAELVATLARYRRPSIEFTRVAGADGLPLETMIFKPSDFDPSRKYPVLMYVYGGPGSQTVRDAWGGSRQLWHEYLAEEKGVIVVSVDNRGTGGRGAAFRTATYKKLGQLEAADQIAAARHLAREPWVDSSRVGIWGWSYGGYMTLMSLLSDGGPQTFRVGMAVAPVTDWRQYDTIYTERYMSTPQRNAAGYDAGAPSRLAARLGENQHLLLVHGDFDDNVHYQNAVQMIDALQAAGKQFDLMVYPGRNHGIAGGRTRLHLFTLLTDYVEQYLVGSTVAMSEAGGR